MELLNHRSVEIYCKISKQEITEFWKFIGLELLNHKNLQQNMELLNYEN